jgi:large subunit ribosomal protein L25
VLKAFVFMNSIEASIRNTNTKGEVNALRSKGIVPAIVYGGENKNQKVSVSKNVIKSLVDKENFSSNILTLNIEGNSQNVLPREIKFDQITDEPIHIDFLRIVKGAKIALEIPVKFINNEKSPGLKRGGVLNIVRRKVELKCPTENIPNQLIVDLENKDIGESFKISSIKLPEGVTPTIQGRDFVVATLAAPTIIKEPEKPAEETAEGAEAAEGTEAAAEGAEGEAKVAETDKKEPDKGDKKEGDKSKKENKKAPTEKK